MDERAGMGKRKEGRQGPRDAMPGQARALSERRAGG